MRHKRRLPRKHFRDLKVRWDEADEDGFAQDVRIVLASAEFSRELTSAVMWLNDRGLDIRCLKMSPYLDDGRVLLDVQQVIPLPEVEDYQIRVREKTRKERESRKSTRDYTKYVLSIRGEVSGPYAKRETVYRVVKHLCSNGVHPNDIINAVSFRKSNCFRAVSGTYQSEDDFIKAATTQSTEAGKSFDSKRWYLRNGERIEQDGSTYVISNGWGGRAVEWIEEVLAAFPDFQIQLWPENENPPQ